ncbi:MAG: AEC family transporter [Propionibacteriaceae bacterium]
MWTILAKALSLVLIVSIGFGMKRLRWVKAEDFSTLSKIVLRVTLPCALATSFNQFEIVPSLLGLTLLAFVANLLQQVVGYLQHRKGTPVQRAFGILHGGSYNIGAFALPYVSAFIGPAAIVYASLFDVGNSLATAGIGRSVAHAVARPVAKLLFTSPVFDTYLALVLMRLLHIQLPSVVIGFTSLVGAANPFLAMFMIGVGLEVGLPRHRLSTAVRGLITRYVFSTLIATLVWFLLPFPHEVKVVVILVLFAPIAAMVPGFTSEIDGHVGTATFMNSVTILIAIVMMPTLYLLVS